MNSMWTFQWACCRKQQILISLQKVSLAVQQRHYKSLPEIPPRLRVWVSLLQEHTERYQNKRGGNHLTGGVAFFSHCRSLQLFSGGPESLFQHVPVSPLQIVAGMSSWLYMRALFRSSGVENRKQVFFSCFFFKIFTQWIRTTSTVALSFFQLTAAHSSSLVASYSNWFLLPPCCVFCLMQVQTQQSNSGVQAHCRCRRWKQTQANRGQTLGPFFCGINIIRPWSDAAAWRAQVTRWSSALFPMGLLKLTADLLLTAQGKKQR